MIAAILLADLTLVVAVSTFAMLVFYLIANIAAFRIPLKYRQYPALVPVIGAVSCIGLIGFLTNQFMDYWHYRTGDRNRLVRGATTDYPVIAKPFNQTFLLCRSLLKTPGEDARNIPQQRLLVQIYPILLSAFVTLLY